MGYVLNGIYHKGEPPKHIKEYMTNRQNSTYKQHDHNRQRKDHAKEILQPRNPDGSPNEDYKQVWGNELG